MADTLLDIVDGLVTALATAFADVDVGDETLPITVEWPDNPTIEISESALQQPLVWVVDVGETLEGIGGYPAETFDVLVVVQMRKRESDNSETLVRALSQLTSEIVRHIRSRDSALEIADAVCVKAQRKNARDMADWNNQGRFYAEILTTWRMM